MAKYHNSGFTLIETVVALSVFITVFSTVLNLFLLSSRAQKKAALLDKVYADVRLILGSIAEKMRVASIDYGYLPYGDTIAVPQGVLALRGLDGESIIFAVKDESAPGVCPDAISSPCLALSLDGGTSWTSLTSREIKVEDVRFYIRPSKDPYKFEGVAYLSNIQPSVTVSLSLRSASLEPNIQNLVMAQTTVVSREYKR
ncbi:MAG: type II secretion system protein [Parcubacteria group bacterium]|nr:type II secretion system protein [Parcubacteria group bacterium]